MNWNSENPFVINPFYFLNVTNTRYEETWMAFIHHINNKATAIIGLISCSMVIYLVLKQTPRQFKPYSRVILLCSSVDLYFVAVDFFVQFRLRISQGMLVYNVVGPLSKCSFWWQCRATCFFSTCILASYMMLPFQYFYRYSTIKNKHPPKALQIILYLCMGALVICVVLVTSTKAFCTLDNQEDRQEYAMYWYPEIPVPQLTFGMRGNIFVFIHLAYFMLVTIVCYALAIFFARRTITVLRRHALQMSQKTFELQRQFGRALFAQAIVPLFSVGPVIFAIIMTFIQAETGIAGELVILAISWFPAFNSLATLVFISPYRNFCLRPFWKLYYKSHRNATNSISVIPVNDQPVL